MTVEEMVREFHSALNVHGGWAPKAPTTDIPAGLAEMREAFLHEEVQELTDAIAAGDVVKIADALGDITYVVGGTAVTYGVPLDEVMAEVHRSNMTKTNDPGKSKLIKGPDYEPPRIAAILEREAEAG